MHPWHSQSVQLPSDTQFDVMTNKNSFWTETSLQIIKKVRSLGSFSLKNSEFKPSRGPTLVKLLCLGKFKRQGQTYPCLWGSIACK